MSGRDVEREISEFFRRMGTPAPSSRLREAVVSERGDRPRRRTLASRAPGAAVALLSLAATIVLAAGLLLIATHRGGLGGFGPAAGPSETASASASAVPSESAGETASASASAVPSESDGQTASTGPSERPAASPTATPTVQPSAVPRPSISMGPSGKFSPAGSMGATYTMAVSAFRRPRALRRRRGRRQNFGQALRPYAPGQFSPTGTMRGPHTQGRATLLADGRVLIFGSYTDTGAIVQPELYDPRTGTFSRTGSMLGTDSFPSAVLLEEREGVADRRAPTTA